MLSSTNSVNEATLNLWSCILNKYGANEYNVRVDPYVGTIYNTLVGSLDGQFSSDVAGGQEELFKERL